MASKGINEYLPDIFKIFYSAFCYFINPTFVMLCYVILCISKSQKIKITQNTVCYLKHRLIELALRYYTNDYVQCCFCHSSGAFVFHETNWVEVF